MKKKRLSHYVLNLLKSIERNLSIYLKNKNPEYLHHLRVEIKKIKAVFSFTENVYKENYSAAPLKSLFNKAGKIRQIQINILLLGSFPIPPENLITQLKKKENSLTQQFIKNSSQYKRLLKKMGKDVCLPELLPDKKIINRYFKKEKRKANKKLETKDRENLHNYRTRIKKMMYVYNALPERIQKEIKFNTAKINKQQEKLGDWHDTYSAVNFLSHENFRANTRQYVLKLKEKEKRQFNAFFK